MDDTIGTFPASFAQRRLWFIHQYAPASSAYHMVVSVPVPAGAGCDLLQRALDVVVAHRETLRTSFAESGQDVVQHIAGDAGAENIADTLIQDDFDWLARIQAAQNDGERILAGSGCLDLSREITHQRLAGDKARIAFAQFSQRLLRGHGRL